MNVPRVYLVFGRVELHAKLRVLLVLVLASGRGRGGVGGRARSARRPAVLDVVAGGRRDETGGGLAQLAPHQPRLVVGELELVAQVRLALQTLLEVLAQLLQLLRQRRVERRRRRRRRAAVARRRLRTTAYNHRPSRLVHST